MSCPILAEVDNLLARNQISLADPVFNSSDIEISRAQEILSSAESRGRPLTVISNDTIKVSNLLTYTQICNVWKGNGLHCSIYNLQFSRYMDSIQKGFNSKGTDDDLEYVQIWINSAQTLVISNLDYVNFRDFPSQTLLNLIQTRQVSRLTTILVTPKVSSLIGQGFAFGRLQELLGQGAVRWQ
jgi:hypothetical protein